MIDDVESIYIERGDDTLQEDIDDFIKFIWRHAEKRGLIVNNKERYLSLIHISEPTRPY